MIYKKYGQAFKKLRLQHRLSLRDFERIGLSKSTLSYFENGKSLISFDKLDLALQEMHTTFRSYMLMLNNDEEDYWLSQFKKIEKYYFSNDTSALHQIYLENSAYDSEESQMIALSAKACYSRLSTDEVQCVEECLSGYHVWHSYEMFVLVNTLDEIKPRLLYCIMERILSHDYQYLKEVSDFRNLLIRLVIRTILSMIRRGYKDYSEKLMGELGNLLTPFDTYVRISSIFVQGCWIYKFEDEKRGYKMVRHTLSILSEIDALDLRKVFLRNFESIAYQA